MDSCTACAAASSPRPMVTAMRMLASEPPRPLFLELYSARPAELKLLSAMAACRLRLVVVFMSALHAATCSAATCRFSRPQRSARACGRGWEEGVRRIIYS